MDSVGAIIIRNMLVKVFILHTASENAKRQLARLSCKLPEEVSLVLSACRIFIF